MNTASQIPETSTMPCPICGREATVDSSMPAGDAQCSQCGYGLWYRVQHFDQAVILDLLSSIDLERAELARVAQALLRQSSPRRIIVNFSLVSFISSTFLAHLLSLQKELQAAGVELTLCGLNPVIREIFHVTKLERLFHFAAAAGEAMED